MNDRYHGCGWSQGVTEIGRNQISSGQKLRFANGQATLLSKASALINRAPKTTRKTTADGDCIASAINATGTIMMNIAKIPPRQSSRKIAAIKIIPALRIPHYQPIIECLQSGNRILVPSDNKWSIGDQQLSHSKADGRSLAIDAAGQQPPSQTRNQLPEA